MEIILNELSLENQFENSEDFFIKFKRIIEVYKIAIDNHFSLLKPSHLYSIILFESVSFHDILTAPQYRKSDEMKRYKSILSKIIQDEPFWDLDALHVNTDHYKCDFTDKINNYGLAEACERDKYVFSFETKIYKDKNNLEVKKNDSETIEIKNLITSKDITEELYLKGLIDESCYCIQRFNNTKLSFEELEEDYGFKTLSIEQRKLFINKFEEFIEMDWEQILKSDGLDYKEYTPSKKNWFGGTEYNQIKIMKFRISQKYRCFGYRVKDTFKVLRFETNHKVSDNG
ncbi:MAG6450 family protein [Planococcus citreus]|uniref:Uncharacterized protein n=1 Tax=Planococcus citreus TaxID=1373 RepID=A0A497YEB3_9BACL|nr:hypothetical protein [Planococcus citreus]RLJ86625.1 hypothetical protein DFR62_2227 [Planococcus citreus]